MFSVFDPLERILPLIANEVFMKTKEETNKGMLTYVTRLVFFTLETLTEKSFQITGNSHIE